jgi:predicted AlkP superfamily phosphohydrolase/phosphomutase
VLDQLTSGLASLIDPATGEPIVTEIRRRCELYDGPYAETRAPDLVFVLAPGYKAAWGQDAPVVVTVDPTERLRYRGEHTMDGVMVLVGPPFRCGARIDDASVVDLCPTLLAALGFKSPEKIDGLVLDEAFRPGYLRPEQEIPIDHLSPTVSSELTPEDEKEILSRLQGLGYLS